MLETTILMAALLVLLVTHRYEKVVHSSRLKHITHRIHVNGTRGKSSVVRLIAGGLRAGGLAVMAKTTGSSPRCIQHDGQESPLERMETVSIREQMRIVKMARERKTAALVMECMALNPHNQFVSEQYMIRSTIGLITNVGMDHLEIMGPGIEDVAMALSNTIPLDAVLITAEKKQYDLIARIAAKRNTESVLVDENSPSYPTSAEMKGFQYIEHKINVALALTVCGRLGVARDTALEGMYEALPDPGAMTFSQHRINGRNLVFVNAFATNDPGTVSLAWELALKRWGRDRTAVLLINCRSDRPYRSMQLGEACARWEQPEMYVVVGEKTRHFIDRAVAAGVNRSSLLDLKKYPAERVIKTITGKNKGNADLLVVGVGNIMGSGQALLKYFGCAA